MIATLANSAWLASCLPEYLRFRQSPGPGSHGTGTRAARHSPEGIRPARSDAVYGFSAIRTVRDYQTRVPLSDYDDYRAGVARIAEGETQVLTCERVRLFEPTSGSSSRGQVDSLYRLPPARVSTRHSRLGRGSVPARPRFASRPWILVRQSRAGVRGGHALRHTGGIRGRQRIRRRSSAAAGPVGDGRPLVRPPLAHHGRVLVHDAPSSRPAAGPRA